MGSGSQADRLVASDTRGTGFESSHRPCLFDFYLLLTVYRKGEKELKESLS